MTSYYGIGIMSGTSLDGLDLCFAEFTGDPETDIWGYRIEQAVTVSYSSNMQERLGKATTMAGIDLVKLQIDYSHFVGQCVEKFIEKNNLHPDFVSSHGHTVFHQPDKGLTFQIGDGEIISTYIRCPFVCNFRSKDVSLGGQGAPLVPCGEKYLFQQTDLCINLGGIANAGCKGDSGFDICCCNMVLNHLAKCHNPDLSYDDGGQLAATGQVIPELLEKLDQLDYYKQTGPRSLGFEWASSKVFPLLNKEKYAIPDLLRTYTEHITDHVTSCCVKAINKAQGSVLVTGGGAFNTTLMLDLKGKLGRHNIKIVETDDELVEYKEALIFAFLGLRSLLNMENVFSSVTGSKTDTVSGSIHHGTLCNNKPSLQDRFNFMIRKKSLGVNELRIIREK
ncbi:anhydro-N-acetylmuramic acid kinase-like [Physella acuta]|uniref:anhydro-N-acetylmuramic acid kinase-like n=1 Tax=Physella acuta TaxID=109671 RepID=UPI0027DD8CBB|nr:anhydro-N-acetylmuramic acid kinase-like [Physella acuta]XP_059140366.1 anhydro-N-acetylmuramic acid kinase-like [Physella acuta]XP_059140367.1 anhydro-N-acetylmuramic acid kinase-like [Physella acuta]XP_059140368.1 anhydro-N-acetylmuramic acid kinase-like [Physella acuta]